MELNGGIRKVDFARNYLESLKRCLDTLSLEQVAALITALETAHQNRRHVFIVGNGGSAATASHMACDLNKTVNGNELHAPGQRFHVVSLADNVPWMTAIANDLGYDYVFSEQLHNLCESGDLLIAITGSGNSPNVVEAVKVAKSFGAKVFGILGFDGGSVRELVDEYVLVESNHYGFIEDIHMVLDHLVTAYFKDLRIRLIDPVFVEGQPSVD